MPSSFKPGKAIHIEYTNAKGESSKRWIIPTFVPTPNIKAIDISDLTEEERQQMEILVQGHLEYRDAFMKTAYDFAEWVEQEANKQVEPKYRTFKIDNIKVDDC